VWTENSQAGDPQGGGSPLVGGAGSIDACQRFWLARSVLPAWGEPSRPGFPPEGETGKGRFKIPCCRRLFIVVLFGPWAVCAQSLCVRRTAPAGDRRTKAATGHHLPVRIRSVHPSALYSQKSAKCTSGSFHTRAPAGLLSRHCTRVGADGAGSRDRSPHTVPRASSSPVLHAAVASCIPAGMRQTTSAELEDWLRVASRWLA
jgi:hypothetical protein